MAESEFANLENQEWLCSVIPSKAIYFPQLGDHVVYLKQAHEEYLEEVKKQKLHEVDQSDESWISVSSLKKLKAHEYVKVVEITYAMEQLRICCLKLELSDNNSFTVKYRHLDTVSDFLVLRQIFDAACQRKWRSGHKLRHLIGKVRYYGQVVSVQDYNHLLYPRSQFKRIRVEWSNRRLEEVSPWEVEPIDQKAGCTNCKSCSSEHYNSPQLDTPEKIGKSIYRPEVNEWPQDGRDSACRRFLNSLDRLMTLPEAKPFLKLNGDLSYFSITDYPVDLQMIRDRLKNLFYRRIEAIKFDVKMLAKNIDVLHERPVVIDSFSSENNVFENCKMVTEELFKMIEYPSKDGAGQSKNSLPEGYSQDAVRRESNKRVADGNESDDNFSTTETIIAKNSSKRIRTYANTEGPSPIIIRRSKTPAVRGNKKKQSKYHEKISINLPRRSSAILILYSADDDRDKSEKDEDGEDDSSNDDTVDEDGEYDSSNDGTIDEDSAPKGDEE